MSSSTQKELHSQFQSILAWPNYKTYSAYLIQVVPRTPQRYDRPWAPAQRGKSERIRSIDARSVYALSTGETDAFEKLFAVLPEVFVDVIGYSPELEALVGDATLWDLYRRAV